MFTNICDRLYRTIDSSGWNTYNQWKWSNVWMGIDNSLESNLFILGDVEDMARSWMLAKTSIDSEVNSL